MVKKDWKVWEIVTESLCAAAAVGYLGLQIYYGYLYESMGTVIVYRVLPSAFLYAGMTVLEIVPELLNVGGKEKLGGRIRTYAVRMARNCKFLFMIGMLVPSVADVIGFRVDASYSFLIMAGILGTLAYYLYRIYRYNSESGK